jgi:hypothetical protein
MSKRLGFAVTVLEAELIVEHPANSNNAVVAAVAAQGKFFIAAAFLLLTT